MVATLDFVPACHGASMYIMSMIVSVTECSLNSPPDWKWGVLCKLVPRQKVMGNGVLGRVARVSGVPTDGAHGHSRGGS